MGNRNYKNHNTARRLVTLAFAIISVLTFARVAVADTVDLAWDANSEPDIAGYRLHYGTASGVYTKTLDTGSLTQATIDNLAKGKTYFFAVTAYDADGLESLPSDEVSLKTRAAVATFVAGQFTGAVFGSPDQQNATLSLALTKTGVFSGRLLLGTAVVSVYGIFKPDGTATVSIRKPALTLSLSFDTDSKTISALLNDGVATAQMNLSMPAFSAANVAPQAGSYTVRLGPAAGDPSSLPDAWGFANLTIAPSGAVRLVGRLADNLAFTLTSVLKADATFSIYTILYQGKGYLGGTFTMEETPGVSDGDGMLNWVKPPQKGALFYKDGFSGQLAAQVSTFEKIPVSAAKSRPAPYTALLSGGDLPAGTESLTPTLAFIGNSALNLMSTSTERLRVTINPTNGLITATFVHPADKKVRTVRGVLFQKEGTGAGFFPGLHTSGRFELGAGVVP